MPAHFLLLFILSLCLFPALPAQNLIEVGKGYSSTSVNTAVFRTNSLVTHGDTQFISYYDNDGYMVLGKRTLGSHIWELKRSPYKGKVSDGHHIISMAVDGKGYLHVAFDHHGNRLNYCKSLEPLSLELSKKIPMVQNHENDVTYPEFYPLVNGDLLFVYRSGASGRGNLVMNRYAVDTQKWKRIHDVLIDGENARNAYWQLCVDGKGTIHLSWVWRETWMVETNHDMCYARSTDGGVTWEKSDGTPYALPITIANAEYAWRIPQKSELINQTSMAADEQGNPYIATYWRDTDGNVPQYRIIWHDGVSWNHRRVSDRIDPFSLAGGGTKMIPISRPQLVVDGRKAYYIFRDNERNSVVSMYTTSNVKKGKWKAHDLTSFSVNAWEPTYDTELWKRDKKLHIFVQATLQGDGEMKIHTAPQPVYVLEVKH